MESWIYVSKLADVVSIIGTLITLWQIHRTRLETARIRRELVLECCDLRVTNFLHAFSVVFI